MGRATIKAKTQKSKVKKTTWLFLFAFILFADLISIYFESEISRYFTKPLLMPLLFLYFVLATGSISSSLKKWMILALLFSWAGDVLLMFEPMNGMFFIFGLAAFLIAHIFYIILFDLIRVKDKVRQSLLPLLPIAVYYIVLIGLLQPHLGEMKKPVSIYGLIISIMLSFAIDLWRIKDRMISVLIISGLFFLSFQIRCLRSISFITRLSMPG